MRYAGRVADGAATARCRFWQYMEEAVSASWNESRSFPGPEVGTVDWARAASQHRVPGMVGARARGSICETR
jgi:hypothetical protein